MGEIGIEQALKDILKRIRNVDAEISNLQNDSSEFNVLVKDNQSPSNSKDNGTNVTVYMAVKGVWDGVNTVKLTGEMTECVDVRERQYYPVAFAEWGKNQRINGLSGVMLEFPTVSGKTAK